MINNFPSNSAHYSSSSHTVVLHKRSDYHSFGVYVSEDIPSGLYVVTVQPDSPAANANIQPGDRVLAINGQLVSSMSKNPKETIVQLASHAQSLTLTIQSSNLLQTLDVSSPNNLNNDNHHDSSSKQRMDIDNDLERFIKSLFSNENLHITPSGNNNEYILSSDAYSSRHRRHHKRRHPKIKQMQSLTNDEQKENTHQLVSRRSIPSMGTSHVILRNSQVPSAKNNEIQEPKSPLDLSNNRDFDMELDNNTRELSPIAQRSFRPSPISLPSDPASPHESASNRQLTPVVQRSFTPTPVNLPNNRVNFNENTISRQPTPIVQRSFAPSPVNLPNNRASLYQSGIDQRPLSINDRSLREVHLRRVPTFQGLGFYLQYNEVYYVVQKIEPNSPAQRADLRTNDVIRGINNRKTDNMSHSTLVQIIDSSSAMTLLVQNIDAYLRAYPQAPRNPITEPTTNSTVQNNKNDVNKRKSVLSRAFSKFSRR